MRKRRRRIEDGIQIAIGQFLDVALPTGSFWCHVPNGGWRPKAEAGNFKRMGVKSGVPDLLVIARPLGELRPVVMWIEVKRPGARATKNQGRVLDQLCKLGCFTTIVTGPEEVERFLLIDCRIPLHASLTIEGAKDAHERNS